jgi:hypothetical protein
MNIMNAMMLSCVKATELMEQKQYVPLSFKQKVQLRMHVGMCSGCRNYRKQTELINKLLSKTFNASSEFDTTELEKSIVSKIS